MEDSAGPHPTLCITRQPAACPSAVMCGQQADKKLEHVVLTALPKVALLLPVCFSCFPLSLEPENTVRMIWFIISLAQ